MNPANEFQPEFEKWWASQDTEGLSLACKWSAFNAWVAASSARPEERAITNAQMAERLRNDADHPASDLYDNEKMWLREAATVYEDMDMLYSAEPPPQREGKP